MASLLHRLLSGDDEVREQAANESAVSEQTTLDEPPAPALEAAHEETDAAASETDAGLIPATKLPSAANSLAELFAEESAAEESSGEASSVEDVPSPEPEVALAAQPLAETPVLTASEDAPKRRGLFAWLFGAKRPTQVAVPEISSVEETSLAQTQIEPVAVAETESAPEAVAQPIDEPHSWAPEEIRALVEEIAEKIPTPADASDDELNWANVFAQPEAVDAIPGDSAEPALDASQPPLDEIPPAPQPIDGDEAYAEIESDMRAEQQSPEPPPVIEEAQTHRSATQELEDVLEEIRGEVAQALPLVPPTDESESQAAISAPPEAHEAPRRPYKDWAFDEKLASHIEWIESHGAIGKRADLSAAELEATELIGVNLRLADLHDVNLRGSDLLLADLREACLVRADLEEASLVGANLEGANLEGASLETAMGLVPRQFAGANLRDAILTPQLMEFEAVPAFERASQNAFHYFAAMTGLSALSWLVIWRTRDIQLLTDSAIIPFLHSRAAATALPTAESYLIVPVALFILYLVFHFHLQHLWDSVGELPAVFPDSHTLGDRGPGIVVGLLRAHFPWMNPDPSSTRLVEKGVCLFGAYWVVPTTLLLFWLRYLTRQDMHGTLLQTLLVVITTAIAFYATTKTGRPRETWAFEKKWSHRLVEKIKAGSPVALGAAVGGVLLFLSVGTIAGVPHEHARAPQYHAASIRRWAPDLLWYLSFDPYADLTEGVISRKPANWNGSDDQVSSVDGLRMNNADFRYAQAYGAFLANAHLWHADFQGAFLSDADLRSVDFGEGNLRYAVMDHAQMSRVNLYRSNLDGADLRRANLHGANLSYASMQDAILIDTQLDSANLYATRLISADLTRANLEKADLRESLLNVAHMDHVDLRGAYLWSSRLPGADLGGAQLQSAILIGADLRGANLGSAQLTGTVLNDANITGASLEGADLRGVLGLTPDQLCSVKSRRGALLDDYLETLVDAQCPSAK